MVTSVPSDHSPRLFTIASGTPFLATLADAFLSGELIAGLHPLADPLAMSSATFFSAHPPRRSKFQHAACRTIRPSNGLAAPYHCLGR